MSSRDGVASTCCSVVIRNFSRNERMSVGQSTGAAVHFPLRMQRHRVRASTHNKTELATRTLAGDFTCKCSKATDCRLRTCSRAGCACCWGPHIGRKVTFDQTKRRGVIASGANGNRIVLLWARGLMARASRECVRGAECCSKPLPWRHNHKAHSEFLLIRRGRTRHLSSI